MMPGETFYADAAQLAAVLDRAPPGQRFIFAKGPRVDPTHPTVQLVRAAVAAGRASEHSAGRDRAGELQHMVRMVAPATIDQAEQPGDVARSGGERERVLAVLEWCAANGGRRPSYAEIAHRAALPTRKRAEYLVRCLAREGALVIGAAVDGKRGVLVLANGRRLG